MANIVWTQETDRNIPRQTEITIALVDGVRIPIHTADVAIDIHGRAPCHAVAHRKLLDAVRSGNLPAELVVTTLDFQLLPGH